MFGEEALSAKAGGGDLSGWTFGEGLVSLRAFRFCMSLLARLLGEVDFCNFGLGGVGFANLVEPFRCVASAVEFSEGDCCG